MKAMKKISILLVALMIFGATSYGQSRFSKVSWEIGFPTGDLKEFLVNEDISLGGISFDYRRMVKDNITVGGNISWAFFNGSSREDLIDGTTTISGLRQFYVNTLPIMVNAHYYRDIGDSQIYFGTGLGGVWTLQRTDIGSYFTDNDNFQFGIMPEIGFNIPFSFTSNVNISAKYNIALASGNSIDYTYFTVGVGWSSWW